VDTWLDVFQLIFMGSASSLDRCLGIIRYWLYPITSVKTESVEVITKFHLRTKHIDLRYHFVREAVKDDKITVIYIPTEENVSDIFTKALAVRGRSTSSDVSSDISPSPLYIPPHRRQPKTECTRGSDTGVRWSCDVTFLSLFHHSPSFPSFHYFSSFYYFNSDFWYIDMHPTLAGLYPFLLGFPARCAFLSYFTFIYMFRIPC